MAAKRGAMSKIERYGLVEEAMELMKVTPALTRQEICDTLNAIGEVPEKDLINPQNLDMFANKLPALRKEIMKSNRQQLTKAFFEGADFDMLAILKDMAGRTSFMIEKLEEQAFEEDTIMKPSDFKALNSELRETLKQITEIHKEVYSMDTTRKFIEIMLETLKEVAPEAVRPFINKIKVSRETNSMVNELMSSL